MINGQLHLRDFLLLLCCNESEHLIITCNQYNDPTLSSACVCESIVHPIVFVNGNKWPPMINNKWSCSITDFQLIHTFLFDLHHIVIRMKVKPFHWVTYWQTTLTLDLQQFNFQFLLWYVFLWRQLQFLSFLFVVVCYLWIHIVLLSLRTAN